MRKSVVVTPAGQVTLPPPSLPKRSTSNSSLPKCFESVSGLSLATTLIPTPSAPPARPPNRRPRRTELLRCEPHGPSLSLHDRQGGIGVVFVGPAHPHLGDQFALWLLGEVDLVSGPRLALGLVAAAHLGIHHAKDAILRYPPAQPRTAVCAGSVASPGRDRSASATFFLDGRPLRFGGGEALPRRRRRRSFRAAPRLRWPRGSFRAMRQRERLPRIADDLFEMRGARLSIAPVDLRLLRAFGSTYHQSPSPSRLCPPSYTRASAAAS